MAAIGKIREQSTLLLIVIGGAMVAFVLGDMFSGRGGGPGDRYVGAVYGEEINMLDYEKRVEAQKQSLASIGQPVSSQAEQQIRNQVWNNMIQEKIMYTELNRLGMRLGQDEFDDIRFGDNVRSEFATDENFQSPETGQFEPQMVQNYFAFLRERYPLFYEVQLNRIVNERLYEKYNNLIKKGIYTNTLDAKNEYYKQERKVRMNFVVRAFDSMADSLVQVSDKELRAYYDKHKDEDRFKREAMVDVALVIFTVEPTDEDEETVRLSVADLVDDFQEASDDSLFVLKYSSSRNAASMPFNVKEHPEMEEAVASAKVGDVIGPYKSMERYCIAKVEKLESEEQATVRHILLSNSRGDSSEKLKQRMDSIKKVIQSKKNFEEMVTKFSEDPGSVGNGGRYENFNRETMVPEFTVASFDKPIGSLNVVETSYGVHLVEPLSRRNFPIVYVRELDARIEPSNKTFNTVYDEANEFSLSSGSVSKFRALAEEREYTVQDGKAVTKQAMNLPGVPRSTDAVRWAHNDKTKVGSVSEPFEFDKQIVVVALEKRTPEGRASFEDAKEEIRPEVVRDKKAELFIAEMAGKTMDQLIDVLGLTMQVATNITEKRPSLPGAANEPYVVGFALSLPEGTTSDPIKGNKGVFVVNIQSKTSVEPKNEYLLYADELSDFRRGQMNTYSTSLYRALKELANVKDERSKVY